MTWEDARKLGIYEFGGEDTKFRRKCLRWSARAVRGRMNSGRTKVPFRPSAGSDHNFVLLLAPANSFNSPFLHPRLDGQHVYSRWHSISTYATPMANVRRSYCHYRTPRTTSSPFGPASPYSLCHLIDPPSDRRHGWHYYESYKRSYKECGKKSKPWQFWFQKIHAEKSCGKKKRECNVLSSRSTRKLK